jgi:hypothetical protein
MLEGFKIPAAGEEPESTKRSKDGGSSELTHKK